MAAAAIQVVCQLQLLAVHSLPIAAGTQQASCQIPPLHIKSLPDLQAGAAQSDQSRKGLCWANSDSWAFSQHRFISGVVSLTGQNPDHEVLAGRCGF